MITGYKDYEMPIVGNGDIAGVLPVSEKLFFASGVSNSQEIRESEYQRELGLLLEQPRDAHLVYFSTLAVFYLNSAYTRHKKRMEAVIAEKFKHYTIVRIGNITFGENPHTLINYLKAHPEAKIRDEYRYVIDKEEFLHWLNLIPAWSCEMNITGKRMKVQDIKNEYC